MLGLTSTVLAQHIESNEQFVERYNQYLTDAGNVDGSGDGDGILCHWFSKPLCPAPWLACGCHGGSEWNWAPNKQKCIRCCHNEQDPNCIECPSYPVFESCEFRYTEESCRCSRMADEVVQLTQREERKLWRAKMRQLWRDE